jgi:hypothetical protein
MSPLVEQLPLGLWNPSGKSPPWDLGDIEVVAATPGLASNADQKRGDRGEWIGLRLKPNKLRMMAITSGLSGEDFMGQQRLSPNRDQAFGVEVLGMNRPQSHLTAW